MNFKKKLTLRYNITLKYGFTLIELLIVIAIIAILAAAVIIAINPGEQLAKARDATRERHVKALESALYVYYYDYFQFPSIPEGFTEICDTEKEIPNCEGLVDLSSLVPRYMASLPKDPQGEIDENGTGYQVAIRDDTRIAFYAPKSEVFVVSAGGNPGYQWPFDYTLISSEGIGPEPGHVATLRADEGKFSGAVAVEEGTENLTLNESSRILSFHNKVNYNHEGEGPSPAPEKGPGWYKFHISRRGVNFRIAQFPYIAQPAATSRTYSIEFDFGDTEGYYWRIDGFTGQNGGMLGNRWIGTRNNSESQSGSLAIFLNNDTYNVDVNDTIYYRYYQVEEKPFATSFTETSRGNGVLEFSVGDQLNITEGSLFFWFRSNGEIRTDGSYDDMFRTNESFLILRRYNREINPFTAIIVFWSGNWPHAHNLPINVNEWALIGFTWKQDTKYSIFVNGEIVMEGEAPIFEKNDNKIRFLQNFNGLIDELTILPYMLSDQEIQSFYSQTKHKYLAENE